LWAPELFAKLLKTTLHYRAATTGKTAKTQVLPGICGIEREGGTPVIWRSCLPKIYRGGPELFGEI